MTYGHNGNAIETITRQRFNDDSSGSTGALVSSSTSPKAWVSFATAYFGSCKGDIHHFDFRPPVA